MKTALVAGLAVALLLGGDSVRATQASEWQIATVDLNGGTFSSLRVDRYGNAHVVYFAPSETTVKYAYWDHSLNKWFTTTLDKSQGFCSMALDSEDRPHVSYLEYGTGKIKYAHWNGSSWQKETLQLPAKEISFYTSIALDSHDYPNISFYEYFDVNGDNALRLRRVRWNGRYWEVVTADPIPGSGKFNSIATDSSGIPHIAYANVKYENTCLRFASWNGKSWDLETVEGVGASGYSAFSVFVMIDRWDVPHITYSDVRNGVVKYAVRTEGTWHIEAVDSVAKVGYPDRNGVTVDDSGNPFVSYYDAGQGILKVAHKEKNKWLVETVDGNLSGYTSSIQIRHGTIWVSYADESSNNLKVASRSLLQAGSPGPDTSELHDNHLQPTAAEGAVSDDRILGHFPRH